jgi:acetyl esterase
MSNVPEAVIKRLQEIGPGFDVPAVHALYQPLLAAQPRDGVRKHADLAYEWHPRCRLDLYQPIEGASAVPAPVIVFVHGGGFVRGDKGQRENVGWHFARQGVVTVLPNYRLAPESRWPSGPQDVVAVWRWLRTHADRYGGNPEQIFLMGESAGAAHVAAAVLRREFQPTDWSIGGAILVSGPYNPRLEGKARTQFGVPTPDPRNEPYFGSDPASWDDASTVDRISAPPFPLLISYSELDLIQMQVQAGELFARLVSQHGYRPELVMLRHHNHFSPGFSCGTGDESLSQPVLRFVRQVTALGGQLS